MLKHLFPTLIGVRRKGVLAPVGGEAEDPLGLDVESSGGGGFPEEQLQASLYTVSVSPQKNWLLSFALKLLPP